MICRLRSIDEMNTFDAMLFCPVSLSIKNTRLWLADSWNWPGVMRSMSPRLWYWSRMPWVCELAQGQPTNASPPINTSTGQAKRNSGVKKSARPRPLVNQITISLSR